MGVEVEVVEYLKQKPDRTTLERIVSILEDPVADLVRKDSVFAKLGLRAEEYAAPEQVVELLLRHPRLLQRPILVRGDRAVIGRPRARVATFLQDASE